MNDGDGHSTFFRPGGQNPGPDLGSVKLDQAPGDGAQRSSKPTNLNRRAAAIVTQSTDPHDKGYDPYEGKNPHAVELGRMGGKKGGKAALRN